MITIFDWFGYKLPMQCIYELIKQAGFDGVLLWWSDEFGTIDYQKNPDLARKNGLFVENIHTPFNNVNDFWLDNLDAESLTDLLVGIAKECAEYEIPTMVVHLSIGNNPPPFNEFGLNRIKRIIDKAEQYGINVAFENLRKINYLDYILSNIDSPYAGFCYDSGHHHCRTPDIDLIEKYGKRLMSLHLHDNLGVEDQHLLPFDGTIEWEKVITKIAQSGYTGSIAIEASNTGYENLTPEEYLKKAFERAKMLEKFLTPDKIGR